MVDRAMMTLIALVDRAMKKKRGENSKEKRDEEEKEDARLLIDRQMGNEIIRLLSVSLSLSQSFLLTKKCMS
jgi:hypothetical protein